MLTKKEKEILGSKKAIVEYQPDVGRGPRYHVFLSLTKGELMALKNAMRSGVHGAVAADVGAYLANAMRPYGD